MVGAVPCPFDPDLRRTDSVGLESEPMRMRRSKRLALELSEDPLVRLGERHLSRHVLRRLCDEADVKTSCGDPDGLRVARLAVQLAGRLLHLDRWQRRPSVSTELARAFARLAAALRMAGRLDHAERALTIAREVVPAHLEGDLYRRRAWLRIYQRRLPEALRDAQRAVELTRGREHALALGTLGSTLYYLGDYRGAIDRLAESLTGLDPEDEYRYCGLLVSYVGALAKGTDADARRALELCPELRSKLKDRHKSQRARLWWSEGLLHARLGNEQKAWWSLDIARRSLIGLKAAPEVAAVVGDMAAVSGEPLAVGHICGEAEDVIAEAPPLAGPLRDLARAARELIPEAAAALRQAAHLLAPCPSL